ncbi:MAG: hypothetical protein WAS56_14575 [Saprospiraceae bacterium]|jgi:hypothetical protein|nr:hypothetical protein [Saprospiraceae bacterium]MBK7467517.1 hypothetical protein [Saprospiraceae bacterium]
MAQQVWNFKDQFGVDHSFGIYHGEESGHFISYLDNQIMHIDFMILAEKQYSFYINHELMRFSIQKIGEHQFKYDFTSDTESSTPFNEYLSKSKNESTKHIWWGIIALLLIIKLIVYLFVRNHI